MVKLRIRTIKEYHSNLWPNARAGDECVMFDYQFEQLVNDRGNSYFQVLEMLPEEVSYGEVDSKGDQEAGGVHEESQASGQERSDLREPGIEERVESLHSHKTPSKPRKNAKENQ